MYPLPTCPNCGWLLRRVRRAGPVDSDSWCDACDCDPPLDSLGQTGFSPKYHSGFWAGEAEKKSPLWERARPACSTPDKGTTPNCRVVIAVDLTVRVVPVGQGDDVNQRVREWVGRGAKETRQVPPYVPGKGFGELPKMPPPPGK